MYEKKAQAPLSTALFIRRVLLHGLTVLLLLLASLAIGINGYMFFEHLTAIDGFLNSAMLLAGMGPVNAPITFAGKLFAGLYALYAGLIFIISAGLVITPFLHRVLHKFHWDASHGN